MANKVDINAIEKSAKSALDDSLLAIDAQTEHSLGDIRQQVLQKTGSRSRSYLGNYWLPAAAFSLVLMGVFLLRADFSIQQQLGLFPADMAAITLDITREDPEMLGDLEFYYWLENRDLPINALTPQNEQI